MGPRGRLAQSAQEKASTYKQGILVIVPATLGLTDHLNRCGPLLSCPWCISRGRLCWCWDSFLSVRALTWPTLLSIHPAVGGVLCSRVRVCQATDRLLPGPSCPPALASESASSCHLCQDLPSSTGCPWPLSLRFSLGTWCGVVSLEVFVVTAGALFCFSSAVWAEVPWFPRVGNLMGKTPPWFWGPCSWRLMRFGL